LLVDLSIIFVILDELDDQSSIGQTEELGILEVKASGPGPSSL
jgi:hypothetical protein